MGWVGDPYTLVLAVTHGICEECLFTKYRPYYDRMKASGNLESQQAARRGTVTDSALVPA